MYDAIVVGLGAMGSAAARSLARRGQRVLGLEGFTRGHSLGSSAGLTRVIRLAYFEHADYVPLLKSAWSLWEGLQKESSEQLLLPTGGLYIGEKEGGVFARSLASARQHGLAHEVLDAAELRRRYSILRIDSSMVALREEKAGVLFADRCIEANLRSAEAAGAELRFLQRVTSWDEGSVRVDGQTYRARNILLTAGAWMGPLLRNLFSLTVERVPVFWFEPPSPPRLPVYLFDDGTGMFYGFPYFADQGLKVARHGSGVTCQPDSIDRAIAKGEDDQVRGFLRRHFPAIADAPLRSATVCMYTSTTDGHFVIDRHPAARNVFYASACSGHGFKFAVVIGEILADLALEGGTRHPIGFLSAARFNGIP